MNSDHQIFQDHQAMDSQNSNPQHTSRRPRGFAATMAAAAGTTPSAKSGKEREKEKERTKLRERNRRAITSKMLNGLRQHGNFPLPARADMNDVLAALAREAGWIVQDDGTTYRHSAPPNNYISNAVAYPARAVENPLSTNSLKICSTRASIDCQTSVLRIDESLSPASFDSVVVSDTGTNADKYTSTSPMNSSGCLEADQLMQEVHTGEHGNDFSGTPYVPVYVMLSSGIINNFCQLVDPGGVKQELMLLKSLNIDGVIINCWWGIVEGWGPLKYEWSGYRELFNIIRDIKLKLQVVMAFNEYDGNDSGGVFIPLPQWVLEIGKVNQDIFFTDHKGSWSTECLSWGIDRERVLGDRTGIEVYSDFMRSFRAEFDDLFTEGLISAVEIGLGASGELKYPSFSERMGWRYPGIGAFQCYDKYSQQKLQRAAKLRGHSFWAKGPDHVGYYNSKPHETRFFCEGGDYDSYHGRFFLQWYSRVLIDHVDDMLSLASLAFDETQIVVKIPAIYWWYRTSSHAAELTAGYYNSTNRDGYSPLFEVLKKHGVTMKLVCTGIQNSSHQVDEASADLDGLCRQVLNAAWDKGLAAAGHGAPECYDREPLMRLVETSKPRNDPDQHLFTFFVFQQPPPHAQTSDSISELEYFVKCMHGRHGMP